MTSFEKYGLFDKLWLKIIDYFTSTYSLPKVCKELCDMLKDLGYDTEITGNKRDSRILRADDQYFQVTRNNGWSKYDITMIEGRCS